MTTQVSGVVFDEKGRALAGVACVVQSIAPILGQDGGARVKRGAVVTTDSGGMFDAELKPGEYVLFVQVPTVGSSSVTVTERGRMVVLDQEAQTLQSALDADVGAIDASTLQLAQDAAAAALASAQAAADSATLVQSLIAPLGFASRADFEAAEIPSNIQVAHYVENGIVCMVRKGGAPVCASTEDGADWSPARGHAVFPEHWGRHTFATPGLAMAEMDAMSPAERIAHQADLEAAFSQTHGDLVLHGYIEVIDEILIGNRCTPSLIGGIAGESLVAGLVVSPRFSMGADGVVIGGVATGGDPGSYAPYMKSLHIWFDQSAAASDPTEAIEYPPAFVGREANGVLEYIRISAGWDGVEIIGPEFAPGTGNPDNVGSWDIGLIQSGCLNKDVEIANGFHFLKVGRIDSWVYGMGGLQAIRNGNTAKAVSSEKIVFGRLDSLIVEDIGIFQGGQIVFDKGGSGRAITDQVGRIQLDGDGSSLTLKSGRAIIDSIYATGAPSAPVFDNKILCEGGNHIISAGSLQDDAEAIIHVTGGTLKYSGTIYQSSTSRHGALVTGGQLFLHGVRCLVGQLVDGGPSFTFTAWQVGYLEQSGIGELIIKDCIGERINVPGFIEPWRFTRFLDPNTGSDIDVGPRTRADMVTAIAGTDYQQFIIKGSRTYHLDGKPYVGTAGATAIADLPGLLKAFPHEE